MPVVAPFLEIAKGNKLGHSWVYKFGLNEDVDTSFETIWVSGGLYPTNDTATTASIVSTESTDTNGDVGAQTFTIQGLDENYVEIEETITMNGQSAVSTEKEFLKINRAFVASGGTSEQVGDISVTVNDNVLALVDPVYKQTVQAHYTVPARHTAFLEKVNISNGKNDQVTFVLYAKPEGGVYRAAVTDFLYGSPFSQDILGAVKFGEKTEIDFRAKGTSENNNVSGEFAMVLIKNDHIKSYY